MVWCAKLWIVGLGFNGSPNPAEVGVRHQKKVKISSSQATFPKPPNLGSRKPFFALWGTGIGGSTSSTSGMFSISGSTLQSQSGLDGPSNCKQQALPEPSFMAKD
jgi:hypothetical protein